MIISTIPSSYKVTLSREQFMLTLFQFPYDVALLHKWFNTAHTVRQWRLNKSLNEIYEHFFEMSNDKHQRLFMITHNGLPFAYCEIYAAAYDRLKDYYNASDSDIGWHLLIGEKDYLGKGLIKQLVYIINQFIFKTSQCARIVGEPDVRVKWSAIADEFAYISQGLIQLPEKTAVLYFCYKKDYHNSSGFHLINKMELIDE